VDVLGCYLLGHFPSQAERVEVIRNFAGISGQRQAPQAAVAEPGGWLSDDFWSATEWLESVRDAAWGNGKCPEGLLGAVLSAYSVRIPSSIRVAPIVHGVASPLNLSGNTSIGSGTAGAKLTLNGKINIPVVGLAVTQDV